MKNDKLADISLEFSVMCIILSKELKKNKEYNISDQFERSSTSISANIAEASHPQSRADMISKFEIALKEAFETDKWLKMLFYSSIIDKNTFDLFNKKCTKIRVLLIASIKTLKSKKN